MCSEELMERISGVWRQLSDPALARAIAQRKLFPCFFGSALRLEGRGRASWRRWRPIPCSRVSPC